MGEGGHVVLINQTDLDWHRTHQHSYQMQWDFPQAIAAGTQAAVYVEWDQGVFTTESDDAGEVTYHLNGTDASFQVRADAKEGFRINVDLNNLPAPGLPPGPLPLGWKHDGHMLFRLSGSGGRFTASPSGPWALVDLAGWMEHLDGSLALNEITLPGTHDTCARAPSSRSPSCR